MYHKFSESEKFSHSSTDDSTSNIDIKPHECEISFKNEISLICRTYGGRLPIMKYHPLINKPWFQDQFTAKKYYCVS